MAKKNCLIQLNRKLQTLNKNITTAEKYLVITSHKSLYEHVAKYSGNRKFS